MAIGSSPRIRHVSKWMDGVGYASALSVAIVVECLVAVGIILAMVRKAGFNL